MGNESWRRGGRDVDSPRGRVAATPRPATRIFREDESRRRGCDVDVVVLNGVQSQDSRPVAYGWNAFRASASTRYAAGANQWRWNTKPETRPSVPASAARSLGGNAAWSGRVQSESGPTEG